MKRAFGLVLALAFVMAFCSSVFAGPILPGGSWEQQVVKPAPGNHLIEPNGPILPGGSWEAN